MRLHTPRNTLLRKLSRAELLPQPPEENGVNVAVALGLFRRRGWVPPTADR